MRVVADSHAITWYVQGSARLSGAAADALTQAETTDGIVVSVATLVDLWYVTQDDRGSHRRRSRLATHQARASSALTLQPIDVEVVEVYTTIPRDVLADPWARFIVATAKTQELPLVTRDGAIRDASIVQTIW